MPDTARIGIRARLLALLLPVVLGLLLLDSWNDHRALQHLVTDAYDAAMLESVQALRGGLTLAPDGELQLAGQGAATAAGPSTRRKLVHVSLTPHEAALGDRATPRPARTLLGVNDLPPPPAPPQAAGPGDTAPPVWYDSVYRGEPVRVVALQGRVVDGRGQAFDLSIQVAESAKLRDQVLAHATQQALLRDVRMLIVLAVLVWWGIGWSLRPLDRLRASVLERPNRDLEPLATRDVPQEVAPLVDAVNLQEARYRELLDEQAQFLADASHQLRTPLAIMLTQAGVALREQDPTLLRETLQAIVAQIARSRRLCDQLLSLAHASDSSQPVDAPGLVSLQAIAKDVVLQYLALAHERRQDLGWAEEPGDAALADLGSAGLLVHASGPELYEALANLVHNALTYTPAGGHITVSVRQQKGMAMAEVQDDGPGVPAARREAVFRRFRQGGAPAAHAAHGAGLGLAIARAYVRRHGGDIVLADATTHPGDSAPGLRVTLRLPLAPGP